MEFSAEDLSCRVDLTAHVVSEVDHLANDAFPAVFGRIVDNGNFDILGTDADDDFLFYLAAFSDQAPRRSISNQTSTSSQRRT